MIQDDEGKTTLVNGVFLQIFELFSLKYCPGKFFCSYKGAIPPAPFMGKGEKYFSFVDFFRKGREKNPLAGKSKAYTLVFWIEERQLM